MAVFSQKLKRIPTLCLVCGVDSGPIRTFLIFFMGTFVFASVCVMLWAFATKRFTWNEKDASLAIEAENRRD